MEYRELGKTGKKAGIIGLGCEHLDNRPYEEVAPVVNTAIDLGVNIFDLFMPGYAVRENIAKAMGSRRKDVMIQGHIGSTDVNQQYDISRDLPSVQKYAEDLLHLFGYIDFGMLFFMDSEEDYKNVFETGFIDYVLKLKKQGDVRHIGFGSHNPLIAAKVVKTGVVESMMFSVNAAFDLYPADVNVLENDFDAAAFKGVDPRRAELYRLCERQGVGITVMKTLGAGKLISPEHTPFAKPMTVPQCIHYALSRPAVTSVMIGCKTPDEVRAAVSYLDTTPEERDYSEVLGTLKSDFRGNCVYCSHCQPCPAEIDIATVNKYLDIAKLDLSAVPPSVRGHYGELSRTGGDCIACGSCESRCPFGVPVIANMAEAARVFGK